jgi:hypothetical protein
MSPEAALQQAAGLFTAGRLDEARLIATTLAAAQPDNFLAHHLLGAIAVRAGKPEDAIDHETRALALRPNDPEALSNRGIALRALGRINEALADYERALAARPGFAPALSLKGVALAALNRHEEAIASYSSALAVSPGYAPAHFNRSFSELALGDFESGLADFEWRWKGSDTQIALRDFGVPQWRGEDPRGRTVLVHAEQGLGDAIQFCRYVPMLAERGANVVFEVQPALAALLSTLPAQVVRMGDPLPVFDLHCPVMSLPLAFGTRLETIPARIPYLHASAEQVERWRQRLGATEGLRIGVAWSGNARQVNDRNRSMPLAMLAPLRRRGWKLIALQNEVRDSDRAALMEMGVEWLGAQIEDFRDTAALVEWVDVVVSVDSSIAHLAGAMGKRLVIALAYAADWRYFIGRDDSPWYPTARLFRQHRPGDWQDVIERVAATLRDETIRG